MKEAELEDIKGIAFEDFVDFLFERDVVPVPSGVGDPGPWYWTTDVAFEPEEVLDHYLRLFRDPAFLLSRFSREELEQGFWAIQGPNLSCSALNLVFGKFILYDSLPTLHLNIPFPKKEECIRSMAHLFEHLFAVEPLIYASNMWWDSFCYDFYCDNLRRSDGGETEALQDVMFETLVEILALDSVDCQYAALHGLGHLMHPDTGQAVDDFIRKHTDMDADLRRYCEQAKKHEVR